MFQILGVCVFVSLSVQPGAVADGDGRVAALLGQPHHVQHGQAQTLLLGLVAHRDGNSAVQEVAAPLQDETHFITQTPSRHLRCGVNTSGRRDQHCVV